MRRESNEAEGTYREAAEEVNRDCRRDIEEENEREHKVNCINIFFPESVGRGVTAGEDLNLGERRNSRKRRKEREATGRS